MQGVKKMYILFQNTKELETKPDVALHMLDMDTLDSHTSMARA